MENNTLSPEGTIDAHRGKKQPNRKDTMVLPPALNNATPDGTQISQIAQNSVEQDFNEPGKVKSSHPTEDLSQDVQMNLPIKDVTAEESLLTMAEASVGELATFRSGVQVAGIRLEQKKLQKRDGKRLQKVLKQNNVLNPQTSKAFHRKAKSIAQRNAESLVEEKLVQQDPRLKFNDRVLSNLATPATVRQHGSLNVRGGGALGVPSPRAVSVIPQKPSNLAKASRNDQILADQMFQKGQQEKLVGAVKVQQRQLLAKNALFQSPQVQQDAADQIMKIIDGYQHKWTQDRLVQAVNEHYEWLSSKIHPSSVISIRKRKIVFDFSRLNQFGTTFQKLWYALLHLNYHREDLAQSPILMSIVPLLPLHIDLVELAYELINKALILLNIHGKTQWLVHNDPQHKKQYVFMDRFKFDMCSMLADEIDSGQVDPDLFEVLLRQIYSAITYYDKENALRIRSFEDVELQLAFLGNEDSDGSSDVKASHEQSSMLQIIGLQANHSPRSHITDNSQPIEFQKQSMQEYDNMDTQDQDNQVGHSIDKSNDSSVARNNVMSRTLLKRLRKFKKTQAIVRKADNMKSLNTGIKLQNLANVVNMPENTKYIELMLINASLVFNPNGQFEVKPADPKMRNLTLSNGQGGFCSRGFHPIEMNYSVQDRDFVRNGQKAMIMISDHIVNTLRAKKLRNQATVDTDGVKTDESVVHVQPSPRFGEYEYNIQSGLTQRASVQLYPQPLEIPTIRNQDPGPSGTQLSFQADARNAGQFRQQSPLENIFKSARMSPAGGGMSSPRNFEEESIMHRKKLKQDIKMQDPLLTEEMLAQNQGRSFMGQAKFSAGNAKIMKMYKKQLQDVNQADTKEDDMQHQAPKFEQESDLASLHFQESNKKADISIQKRRSDVILEQDDQNKVGAAKKTKEFKLHSMVHEGSFEIGDEQAEILANMIGDKPATPGTSSPKPKSREVRSNGSQLPQLDNLSQQRSNLAKSRHSQHRAKLRTRETQNSDIQGLGDEMNRSLNNSKERLTKPKTPQRTEGTPKTNTKENSSKRNRTISTPPTIHGISGHPTPNRTKVYSHFQKPPDDFSHFLKKKITEGNLIKVDSHEGFEKLKEQNSIQHQSGVSLSPGHKRTAIVPNLQLDTMGRIPQGNIFSDFMRESPNFNSSVIKKNIMNASKKAEQQLLAESKSFEDSNETEQIGIVSMYAQKYEAMITKEQQEKAKERIEKFKRFERINLKSKMLCNDLQAGVPNIYAQEVDLFQKAIGRKINFNTADYLRDQLLKNRIMTQQQAAQRIVDSRKPMAKSVDKTSPRGLMKGSPTRKQRFERPVPSPLSVTNIMEIKDQSQRQIQASGMVPFGAADRHLDKSPGTEFCQANTPISKTSPKLPEGDYEQHSIIRPSREKLIDKKVEEGTGSGDHYLLIKSRRNTGLYDQEPLSGITKLQELTKPNTAIIGPDVKLVLTTPGSSNEYQKALQGQPYTPSEESMQKLDQTIYASSVEKKSKKSKNREDAESPMKLQVIGVKQKVSNRIPIEVDGQLSLGTPANNDEEMSLKTRSSVFSSRQNARRKSQQGTTGKSEERGRKKGVKREIHAKAIPQQKSAFDRKDAVETALTAEMKQSDLHATPDAQLHQQSFGDVSGQASVEMPSSLFKNPTIKKASLNNVSKQVSIGVATLPEAQIDSGRTSSRRTVIKKDSTKVTQNLIPSPRRKRDPLDQILKEEKHEESRKTLDDQGMDNYMVSAAITTDPITQPGVNEDLDFKHSSHSVTRQIAEIRRVEPIFTGEDRGSKQDGQFSQSQASSRLPNQYIYSQKRRRKSLVAQATNSSATGTPNAQGLFDMVTHQTISAHGEKRKFMNLISMRGTNKTVSSKVSETQDLVSNNGSRLRENQADPLKTTSSNRRRGQIPPLQTPLAEDTINQYVDRLNILNNTFSPTDFMTRSLIPRSTKVERATPFKPSDVPPINLEFVRLPAQIVESISTERIAAAIRQSTSQMESSPVARSYFGQRKLTEVQKANRTVIEKNREEVNFQKRVSQYRVVLEGLEKAKEHAKKQKALKEEAHRQEKAKQLQTELVSISREITSRSQKDALIGEGEVGSDDEIDDEHIRSSEARFMQTIEAQVTTKAGITDIKLIGVSPISQSPRLEDGSSATIQLNTLQSGSGQPSVIHFPEKIQPPKLEATRIPTVSFRKLQPIPASKRHLTKFLNLQNSIYSSNGQNLLRTPHADTEPMDLLKKASNKSPVNQKESDSKNVPNRILQDSQTVIADSLPSDGKVGSSAEIVLINQSSGIDAATIQNLVRVSGLSRKSKGGSPRNRDGRVPIAGVNKGPHVIPQPLGGSPRTDMESIRPSGLSERTHATQHSGSDDK